MMLTRRHLYATFLFTGWLVLLPVSLGWAAEKKAPKITYEEHVKPILRQKCFACHNADKRSGDLDMTNFTSLMEGGGSGPVIEAGDAESSYLYLLVTHDSEPYMPPESPRIADDMLETIRKWIDGGALENAGSQAAAVDKPKFDLGLEDAPTERPKETPLPPRLSRQPLIYTPKTAAVTALATSPWAPVCAVAGQHQILLYNTQSLELLGVLPFPEGVAEVLKFSRNGRLLLAGGGQAAASGKVIVWDITTGQRVFEVGDELDTVLAADISSDQTLIALGGPQRVVRIYSTETGKKIHELRKHTDWVTALEFSPDSVLLATGDRSNGLYVWEAWTGREYLTLKGHSGMITGVSWRADSNILASCGQDGNVHLWEMENGSSIKRWGAHGGGATCVEYTRDGRLVTSGRDRRAKLWDGNGKQLRAFDALPDIALEVTYCDETNRVAAGDWLGNVLVWESSDGKQVGALATNPPRIEQRLQRALALLTARKEEQKKLDDAMAARQRQVDDLTRQLAAAQTAVEAAGQATKKNASSLAQIQNELKQTQEQLTAIEQRLGPRQRAVKPLQSSLDQAQSALQLAPQDQQLQELVAQIDQLLKTRLQQIADDRDLLAREQSKSNQLSQKVAATQKEMAEAQAEQQSRQADLNQLMPKLKAAQDQLVEAKKAADAKRAELTAAEQEVARWKDELAFAEKAGAEPAP